MKTFGTVIFGSLFILAVFGLAFGGFSGPRYAQACGMGWGAAGGGAYVPQRRGPSGSFMYGTPPLTQQQAQKLAADYVKRENPNLKIGRLQDAGNYYEAEVLGANGEVVQHLGVDKESGRMISLN